MWKLHDIEQIYHAGLTEDRFLGLQIYVNETLKGQKAEILKTACFTDYG